MVFDVLGLMCSYERIEYVRECRDMNNRYMLFCGHNYHPYGGMGDFKGFYDTIEDAWVAFCEYERNNYGCDCDWFHVYDLVQQCIVKQNG
jgi:hypothetical protein